MMDSNFDGIANKFDQNIYGTSKGRLRHQLLLAHLSKTLNSSALTSSMKVLDAGGGTGMMALEFCKRGHQLTIVDTSGDALDIARERLAEFPNTRFVQQDVLTLNEKYDFIICHALLEWLKEPLKYIAHFSQLLTPKGHLSLSFFNHDAKVFNNLLYGNFSYVIDGLPPKNTVRLNPHNAQKPADILSFIEEQGSLRVESSQGIRCIHDYMLDKSKIAPNYQTLFKLELEYGTKEPYKWLGKYFHIMLKKD